MIVTHEHTELYRQGRSFVEKELNPNIVEWERAGIWPAHEILKKMGQLGFLVRARYVRTHSIASNVIAQSRSM